MDNLSLWLSDDVRYQEDSSLHIVDLEDDPNNTAWAEFDFDNIEEVELGRNGWYCTAYLSQDGLTKDASIGGTDTALLPIVGSGQYGIAEFVLPVAGYNLPSLPFYIVVQSDWPSDDGRGIAIEITEETLSDAGFDLPRDGGKWPLGAPAITVDITYDNAYWAPPDDNVFIAFEWGYWPDTLGSMIFLPVVEWQPPILPGTPTLKAVTSLGTYPISAVRHDGVFPVRVAK